MAELLNGEKRIRFGRAVIVTLMIMLMSRIFISFAEELPIAEAIPFDGVPKATINITDLDDTGKLIYCGVDIAVFWDPDKDGRFVVVPDDSKIKRLITTNTNITFDLGPVSTFKKGVQHKLAMRTLYVPIGVKQEPIVIADADNGNDGWVEIPDSLFVPTYFINKPEDPYIKHTEKWDENRTGYNDVKIKNLKKDAVRGGGVFWSGEKLILNIETAEIVSGVAVSIEGERNAENKKYKTVLTEYKPSERISEGAIYTGELWEKSMFNKWGNYIPKELTVKMEILGSEGDILEERNVEIVMDNRDLYYRASRKY